MTTRRQRNQMSNIMGSLDADDGQEMATCLASWERTRMSLCPSDSSRRSSCRQDPWLGPGRGTHLESTSVQKSTWRALDRVFLGEPKGTGGMIWPAARTLGDGEKESKIRRTKKNLIPVFLVLW